MRHKIEQKTRILDAFEELLFLRGPRGATLDEIATKVGLTRSGLLHHFPSRNALIEALLQRMDDLVDQDIQRLLESPEDSLCHYIHVSRSAGLPVERTVGAAIKVASNGHIGSKRALREARARWHMALLECGHDEVSARMVMLVGDGMSRHLDMAADPETDEFIGRAAVEEICDRLTTLGSFSLPCRN